MEFILAVPQLLSLSPSTTTTRVFSFDEVFEDQSNLAMILVIFAVSVL